MANIELHTFLARTPKLDRTTILVFDLDPGEPAGVLDCAEVALWLKELLGLKLKRDFSQTREPAPAKRKIGRPFRRPVTRKYGVLTSVLTSATSYS